MKAKEDVRQKVYVYRQKHPDTSRASNRKHVYDHYHKEPEHSRASTRARVMKKYYKEPEMSRASTRTRVKKHYKNFPEESKASARQRQSKQYHRKIQKSRASARERVLQYRKRNPIKSRVDSRVWVAKYYRKNLQKSRVLCRASSVRQYMKDIKSSRRKSKFSSTVFYRKRVSLITRQRRERYCLAEPRQQKVTCLLKSFQDIFYSAKKIRSQIMKSLESLPNSSNKKGQATNYALCKLAASHLVRLSLLERKTAVTSLLRTKKAVSNLELDSEADFGGRNHTVSREPFFYEAAYDYFDNLSCCIPKSQSSLYSNGFISRKTTFKCKPLPNPIPVQENGQCHLSDISNSINCRETLSGISKGQSKQTTDNQPKKHNWSCTPRCKSLTDKEVAKIVSLKNKSVNDVPDLRKALEECDECPHIQSFKQEWHV